METPQLIGPAAVRDHLDLIVSPEDRCQRSAFVILCDPTSRPMTHAAVDDLPPDPPAEDCTLLVEPFVTVAAEADPAAQILIGLTRPGAESIGDVDRRWFHGIHAVCGRRGVPVLGVYLLTPHATTEIHLDDTVGC